MPEAPLMYDITTDEMRPMTQADVEKWQMWQQATGVFLEAQDVLRTAYRMVCAGEMELKKFRKIVQIAREDVGTRSILQYEKPKYSRKS